MSTLSEKIEQAVNSANGDLSYEDFVATCDQREKLVLLDTLRDMEKRGIAKRNLVKGENGKMSLRIQRGS